MGSCNFRSVYCGIGGAFGQVPHYPSDEEIAKAKVDFGWEEFDDETVGSFILDDCQQQCVENFDYYKKKFEDRVSRVVSCLWDFEQYGHEYPYAVEMEQGYYDGWRVILESRHCHSYERDRTEWLAWCELVDRTTCDPTVDCEYGENAPRVRFTDYYEHLREVNDAVVWAFETLAKKAGLDYVSGGWVGGATSPDDEDFTPIEWREKWETMFPEYK